MCPGNGPADAVTGGAAAGGPGGAGLSAGERRAVKRIDLRGLLSFLGKLIPLRTVSGRETPAQEAVAERMEQVGLRTDVWPLDFEELRRHPAYGADVEREEGLGVVGVAGDEEPRPGDRSLVLNAHVDVVPAADPERWRRPPWEATLEGERIFGRGAVDTKGSLCCALYAAKAIRDAGLRLKGQLKIHSVIGEEDGGVGTLAALLRGHSGDGAVVLEPTRLAVAPAQAGALNFRVTVPGRAAHGALRTEGVDPVEKFIPVYRGLRELEAARNRGVSDPLFGHLEVPFPIAVGRVRAGDWASNVPDSLTFEGRYGVAPGEELDEARAALESAVAEAADRDPWLRERPPEVEWWGAQFAPARTETDDPLVTTVAGAVEGATGEPPTLRGMPYGADMRLLVNEAGMPTVLFGPGDVRHAHRPNEHVPVGDLEAATRALVLAALRFCGYREA